MEYKDKENELFFKSCFELDKCTGLISPVIQKMFSAQKLFDNNELNYREAIKDIEDKERFLSILNCLSFALKEFDSFSYSSR